MVFRVADFEGGATPPTPTPVILKNPSLKNKQKTGREREKKTRQPDM